MDKKIFQWALILGAIILGLFIIKPFIAAIAFAGVLAYIFYPGYKWLSKKTNKWFSASLITIAVIIVILSFIAWGINFLLTEFSQAYLQVSGAEITQIIPKEKFGEEIGRFMALVISKFVNYLSDLISKLPTILLSFFVFVMSFFYFLKDGKKVWVWLKENIPMKKSEKKEIIGELVRYTHAFIYVWLLIAVLQGIVAAVGFYLFGYEYWILAGFVAAILSFIPILGPYLVYLPTGAYTIISGDIIMGLGLITYGLIIGSILDYIIRPFYTGKRAAIHPLIVLIGIFGGLLLIGPAGIILGPLLLLIVIAIFKGTSFNLFGKNK
ncbi:AI-2E family transporter [Candidatus Woesearchaeota archaeon]|nr:AI-2E family transporter [Candidatus Woesearchaeota archaeon]